MYWLILFIFAKIHFKPLIHLNETENSNVYYSDIEHKKKITISSNPTYISSLSLVKSEKLSFDFSVPLK